MCVIDDCDSTTLMARGMCNSHYKRWYKYGNPRAGQRKRESLPSGKSNLYKVWADIRNRCLNPSHKDYQHYGGRGISVHEPWANSFNEFYKYVGDTPFVKAELDRIDNDRGYVPGNLRWCDRSVQAVNRRERSDHTGVRVNGSKFQAIFRGKYIGTYPTLGKARRAYLDAKKEYLDEKSTYICG